MLSAVSSSGDLPWAWVAQGLEGERHSSDWQWQRLDLLGTAGAPTPAQHRPRPEVERMCILLSPWSLALGWLAMTERDLLEYNDRPTPAQV